jgi:hypothetical protein
MILNTFSSQGIMHVYYNDSILLIRSSDQKVSTTLVLLVNYLLTKGLWNKCDKISEDFIS